MRNSLQIQINLTEKVFFQIKKEKVIKNVNVCEKKSKKENVPQTYKKITKKFRRQISFTETWSEEDIDGSNLCDDDEMDDMVVTEPSEKMFGVRRIWRYRELWFRCVICGMWAHADFSGFDTAENYTSDHCMRKIKIHYKIWILQV